MQAGLSHAEYSVKSMSDFTNDLQPGDSKINSLDSDSSAEAQPNAVHLVSSQLLHDLRTPLNQIIGYSEMLGEQMQQENRDDLAVDTNKIRGAGKYLLSLIETHFQAAATDLLLADRSTPVSPAALETQSVSDSIFDSISDSAAATNNAAKSEYAVLIVDDNESNRDVLARRLSKQNYRVEMAENGREALDKVRAQAFDVVLLDVMMPQMDGYEVLQRMKADENLRHIPVIMISALGEMDSVVRCIEMGAEDYLPKPFSPTLLRARIGACLDKKRAHDREARLLSQVQENYAKLRRIEQQRDDLMHMIIHDLRSPLSSNIAGIEMVDMLGPLSEEQRECLQIAMRSGQNLLELINEILDLAVIESGRLTLSHEPVVLADVIHECLALIDVQAQEAGIHIRLIPCDPTWMVDVDRIRIKQVLINLLSNAIKYNCEQGTVEVSCIAGSTGRLHLCIKDTGAGLSADDLQQLFQPFNRLGQENSTEEGTGIGLALTQKLVELMGGTVRVTSTLGVGSEFCVEMIRSDMSLQAGADVYKAKNEVS